MAQRSPHCRHSMEAADEALETFEDDTARCPSELDSEVHWSSSPDALPLDACHSTCLVATFVDPLKKVRKYSKLLM